MAGEDGQGGRCRQELIASSEATENSTLFPTRRVEFFLPSNFMELFTSSDRSAGTAKHPGAGQCKKDFRMAVKKAQTRKKKSVTNNGRAELRPIGVIRSVIKRRSEAPKQGSEGAPDAWLELNSFATEGIEGITAGDDILVLTWLHEARRDVLKVHPRSDPNRALTGVFWTRSPDRPNPLGLHRVTVREIVKNRIRIGPIEVIDGTPVVDIKPALSCVQDS